MKKLKYYYNPKTLNYEKVETSWKNRIWLILGWISTTIFFAVLFFIIYSLFFESPQELYYKRELAKMKLEYKLMRQEMNNLDQVLADLQSRDENIYRVIFEADPINPEIRSAGYGGSSVFERFEGYENESLMRSIDSSIQKMKRKLYVQSKSYDEITTLIKNKEGMLASIPAIQPVANKNLTRLASGYGYRVHPIYKTVKFHEGLDFSAPSGTEIYATGDGVVTNAGKEKGYGNQVVIDHDYGYVTSYSHMSKITVRKGQKVKRGEIIGYIGSTGLSTAPHLHYEIVKNGAKINPINYFYNDLTPAEYDKLIEIANMTNQSFD